VIGSEQERPQGPGDVFSVHLWDTAGERFVTVRVSGAGDAPAVESLVVADGAAAQAAGAQLVTESPLERWRVTVDAPDETLECELHALCAPVGSLDEERYTQLCAVSGSLAGYAVRSHLWGRAITQQRLRLVSAAVPDGRFVTVAAARPAAGVPHGEEVIAGHVVEPGEAGEAQEFEDVRLSTIYDSDGRPRTAGLELYRNGDDELPTRASGEAVWSGPGIGFFKWTVSGSPGWGAYEVLTPS
jgi:hypothetical protein